MPQFFLPDLRTSGNSSLPQSISNKGLKILDQLSTLNKVLNKSSKSQVSGISRPAIQSRENLDNRSNVKLEPIQSHLDMKFMSLKANLENKIIQQQNER